jgi:hypothetical protein
MALSLASEPPNRPRGGLLLILGRARSVVAIALALLLLVRVSAAKDFEVSDSGWQGASEFYGLAQQELGKSHVQVLATLDYDHLRKEDGILILHPELELDYEELSAFLRAGGRLAVLDDRGEAASFLARFQIRRVEAPRNPAEALRDNPNLPIAVPAVEQVAGQEQNRHPVVAGVDRVVTNHPTALEHPNLTQVLKIRALGEPDATLAVTGIIAKSGRLFAMGDPSVVINQMLRYPGNRAFAVGLVKYLVENDLGNDRGGKLFVVANRFGQRGHFGGSRGVLGQFSNLSGSFSSFLTDLSSNGIPPALDLSLAVLACAGLLVWSLRFSFRPYRRVLPRYALPQPLAAQGGLAGRAAVLSAPGTDPVLLVLELRAALVDALCQKLGLARLSSPEQILRVLEQRQIFGRPRMTELSDLFREFSAAQSSLLSRKRLNVSGAKLRQISDRVLAILAELLAL